MHIIILKSTWHIYEPPDNRLERILDWNIYYEPSIKLFEKHLWIFTVILLNVLHVERPSVMTIVSDHESMIMGHHMIVPGYDCFIFWPNPCHLHKSPKNSPNQTHVKFIPLLSYYYIILYRNNILRKNHQKHNSLRFHSYPLSPFKLLLIIIPLVFHFQFIKSTISFPSFFSFFFILSEQSLLSSINHYYFAAFTVQAAVVQNFLICWLSRKKLDKWLCHWCHHHH